MTNRPTELNQLRVAFLTNYLPPYNLPMLQLVTEAIPQLRIFLSTAMGKERHWQPEWRNLSVTVQRSWSMKSRRRHPRVDGPLMLYFPYDTIWQLQQFRPHVVVSGQLGLRTILSAVYRRLHPASRLIVWATLSEQSELKLSRMRKYVRSWIVPQADHILVNGKSCERYFRGFGVDASKMTFFPYTTDIQAHAALPHKLADRNPIRLFFVGQLIERKGLVQFLDQLEVWAKAHPDQEIEFVIAGDGPERSALMAIPLPTNVKTQFLGNLQYEDMPQAYAQGDIFVFPSLVDEWGIVVNEAMAAGLPILGSLYSQAVQDLVQEGETGWLFRPDQPDELAAALDRALTTPREELLTMSKAARKVGLQLTPEFAANQLLSAIESVWRTPS